MQLFAEQRLYEKYRPQDWEEVIGQQKAVNKLKTVGKRGLGGRSFWISGQSGTGKTTLALLLAREVAEDMNIQELDASELTPAKLRKIEDRQSLAGMSTGEKRGRVYIVNEAHGLRRDTVRQLLVVLERLPRHVVWIFTTTRKHDPAEQTALFDCGSEDSGPLMSRCIQISLAQRGLAKPFAKRAKQIAEQENLDGQPLKKYVRLVREKRNNMREVLEEIEAGEMLD